MKKAVIIADSYGGERIHNGKTEVSKDETYPVLVKKKISGYEFFSTSASFRKMTHVPELILNFDKFDVLIIQCGIVDCYPRPLSQSGTISQSFFKKLLRKIIRLNRKFVIKFVRNKPWTSLAEFEESLKQIHKAAINTKIVFINIAPVNLKQERETPGADFNIKKYNSVLKQFCELKNCCLIDIYSILRNLEDYESYLNENDSHLNKKGNVLYANEIIKLL